MYFNLRYTCSRLVRNYLVRNISSVNNQEQENNKHYNLIHRLLYVSNIVKIYSEKYKYDVNNNLKKIN